jgi:hypothetical protein
MKAMQVENLVALNDFCASHNIEISFINSLQQSGLVEIVTVRKVCFISVEQLNHLERIVRLYYEMDINLEGIETITHLLQQIQLLQSENIALRNRLRLYE